METVVLGLTFAVQYLSLIVFLLSHSKDTPVGTRPSIKNPGKILMCFTSCIILVINLHC